MADYGSQRERISMRSDCPGRLTITTRSRAASLVHESIVRVEVPQGYTGKEKGTDPGAGPCFMGSIPGMSDIILHKK